MKYVRLYAGKNGDSYFEDVEVEMSLVDLAPPAPPLDLSPSMPSTNVAFLRAPTGWYDPSHPAPRRLLFLFLAGELEVTVSDGQVRRFAPGSIVLAEDMSGKGHASRVVGNDDVLMAIVQLAH